MVGGTAAVSSDWNRHDDEGESLRKHRCNVLLEGPAAVTDAALHVVTDHREQIAWAGSETLGRLKPALQTLIVRNVGSLSRDDQARLLAWLGATASHARIISTSERPLFARVAAGSFDPALYYRLNVVFFRLRPSVASREAHNAACDQQSTVSTL